MKLHPAFIALLLSAALLAAQEPGTAPAWWFENVPAGDASIQSSLVFRTIPGVQYTVETSHDLTTWTELDAIYGMGHEFVTPMRQFTAPPPLPPGTPPPTPWPPHRIVSLRMTRSSATAGGTVVSWISLDDQTARMMLLPDSLHTGWAWLPYFSERYGAYYFFVGHPLAAIPPPLENPELGPLDAAMIATLQANLADMNQRVADSIARSRNSPPPAPPDPLSKKFWRIKADWGLDSDADGSPDWLEFATAAANPAGVAGLRADAFDADTDHNAVLDGSQLDSDNDSTCDAQDIKPTEKAIAFIRVPLPRYGYFPITITNTNAAPPAWPSMPFQINDKGTVLYATGVWRGGAWLPLTSTTAGLRGCQAKAINDSDIILGGGTMQTNPNVDIWEAVLACWPAPNVAPIALTATLGGNPVRVVPSYHFASPLLHPGPVLAHDGRFIMPSYEWVDGVWVSVPPSVWTLPHGGVPLARQPGAGKMQYIEGGVAWGNYPDPEDLEKPLLHAQVGTTMVTPLPLWAKNVVQTLSGAIFALSTNANVPGRVFADDTWLDTAYAQAVDLSADGTAIGRSHDGFTAPIMQNGNWHDITETTPGLPAGLRTSTLQLIDTTASGWVLAEQIPQAAVDRNAVMLPLKLEGRWTDADNGILTAAVGVDDFSIGSTAPGFAVGERLWIMAPLGGGPASAVLRAPLNANTPLTLSSDFLNLGGPDGSKTVTAAENPFTLAAKTTATTGQEFLLELKLREAVSQSTPIGVKVMKSRTIKVNVFEVTKKDPGGNDTLDNPPSAVPTNQALTDWLNRIFVPQLNATVEITTFPTRLRLNWDTATANGTLDVSGGDIHSAEQAAILTAIPVGTPVPNVTVFLLGGDNMIKAGTHNAFGLANRDKRTCWVIAENLSGRQTADVAQAIAHEIGHVIVGYGHPDENTGPARLPGTNHKQRLMRSGDTAGGTIRTGHPPGYLLVKQEWDEAEAWMASKVDTPQQPPQ